MELNKFIGTKIKKFRESRNMTQDELGYSFLTKSAKIKLENASLILRNCYSFLTKSAKIKPPLEFI